MINLSELERESNTLSPLKKLKSHLLVSDIYFAESIKDYKEACLNLSYPWYKKFPIFSDIANQACIIIQNIKLQTYESYTNIPYQNMNWFVIEDETDFDILYWNPKEIISPSINSYEELAQTQGLKENDFVYDIFFRKFLPDRCTHIIEVQKYNKKLIPNKKISLDERIKKFFPNNSSKISIAHI